MFAMDPMEIPPLIADAWDKGGGLVTLALSGDWRLETGRAHTDKGTESAGLYPRRDESRQSPQPTSPGPFSLSLSFFFFRNEAKWGSSLHQLAFRGRAARGRTRGFGLMAWPFHGGGQAQLMARRRLKVPRKVIDVCEWARTVRFFFLSAAPTPIHISIPRPLCPFPYPHPHPHPINPAQTHPNYPRFVSKNDPDGGPRKHLRLSGRHRPVADLFAA
ncbi:hypothetical protein K456DRAFT_372450 [Colletotrichum gloeosporioides 23]|nr:hypothetical protein K456DRAFT_372450 [Colletotrichum gloeosporioides 23]